MAFDHKFIIVIFLPTLSTFICSSYPKLHEEKASVSRGLLDLRILSIKLPNSSYTGSNGPSVRHCCLNGSWIPPNGCASRCRLVLASCLTTTSVSSDRSLSSEPITNRLVKVVNWSRSVNQTDLDLLPIKCQLGREQLQSPVLVDWSSNSTAITDRVYRFRLGTVIQTELTLVINLYHQTPFGDRWLLDTLGTSIELDKSRRHVGGTGVWAVVELVDTKRRGGLDSYSIQLAYKYACRSGYYGPLCDHYCRPRNSILGHYECDSSTGAKLCHSGWTGSSCNKAVCDKGCIHGMCLSPGICKCLDGWTGSRCDQCLPTPGCQHGSCKYRSRLADWEPFTCVCQSGWKGMLCNFPIDYCQHGVNSSASPCLNGGQCHNTWTTSSVSGNQLPYTCECPHGFSGMHCERQLDNCRYHGCRGKGKCQIDGSCRCEVGFYGSNCQFNHTNCSTGPCIGKQSRCLPSPSNNVTVLGQTNAYHCQCELDRYGRNCEYTVDDCNRDREQPCLNGGKCVDLVGSFACICPAAFTGTKCQLHTRACRLLSCANSGQCIDHATHFTCLCPYGWTGPTCRQNVNECALKGRALPLCQNGAGCRDLPGSFECLCQKGWKGRYCSERDQVEHILTSSNTSTNLHTSTISPNQNNPYRRHDYRVIGVLVITLLFALLIILLLIVRRCWIRFYKQGDKKTQPIFDHGIVNRYAQESISTPAIDNLLVSSELPATIDTRWLNSSSFKGNINCCSNDVLNTLIFDGCLDCSSNQETTISPSRRPIGTYPCAPRSGYCVTLLAAENLSPSSRFKSRHISRRPESPPPAYEDAFQSKLHRLE